MKKEKLSKLGKAVLTVSPMILLLSGCSIYTQDDMDEQKEKYEAQIEDYENDIDDYEDEIDSYKEQIAEYEEQIAAYEASNGNSVDPDIYDDDDDSDIDVDSSDYDAIYGDFLATYEDEDSGSTNFDYSYIYLDSDDTPELCITCMEKTNIYTIDEYGDVVNLVQGVPSLDLNYYEGMSVIAVWGRSDGGGDTGNYSTSYYVVTEDTPYVHYESEPDFGYVYISTYDDNDEWVSGETTYYTFGTEVTEEDYYLFLEECGISEFGADDADVPAGCVGYSLVP